MEIGTEIIIDGEITYSQDFTTKRHDLSGITFTVVRISMGGAYVLEAPGYGKEGDYGNGQIYVYGDYKKSLRVVDTQMAEVKVGDYYAYKIVKYPDSKPLWFDRAGVVTDRGYIKLLEELTNSGRSNPLPD